MPLIFKFGAKLHHNEMFCALLSVLCGKAQRFKGCSFALPAWNGKIQVHKRQVASRSHAFSEGEKAWRIALERLVPCAGIPARPIRLQDFATSRKSPPLLEEALLDRDCL